jgi:hypothetical protein
MRGSGKFLKRERKKVNETFYHIMGVPFSAAAEQVGLYAASPPLKYRQADFRVRAFRCYPSRKKMKMIRYINFAFLLLLLFTSCGEKQKPVHIKEMAAKQDSLSNIQDNKKTIHHLQYNYPIDAKLTAYHGTIKASAAWEDKKGKNILIITERPQYFWQDENKSMEKFAEDPDSDTEVAELFAWHYIFDPQENKWKVLWTLNDFKFSCCDVKMEYTPYTLRISDLDSNGIAESIFTYAYSLGTGPIDNSWKGKLILHTDTLKYSIKGNLGRTTTSEEKKLIYSAGFDQLPPSFKDHSKKTWEYSGHVRDSIYYHDYLKIQNNF